MKNNYLLAFLLFFSIQSLYSQQLIKGYDPKSAGMPYEKMTEGGQGNILLYGSFDQLNGDYVGQLVKIDAKGQLVESFKKIVTNGNIYSVRSLSDGKILMSGNFTQLNDQPCKSLVRLNSDGSLDPLFSSAILNPVTTFALQSTGKILVITGTNQIVRLNSNGTTDQTFVSKSVYSFGYLSVAPDDAIYYSNLGKVYKLNADGSVNTTFAIGFGADNGQVDALTVQSDGGVLVGGNFSSYNAVTCKSIVRLLPNGAVDSNFNLTVGPTGQIFNIIERKNKNLLIGGQFYQYNNQPGNLVELKSDGTLERIIAVVQTNWITSIVDTDERIITIGGELTMVNGLSKLSIARFNNDYTINTAFNPLITYNNPNSRFVEVRDNGSVVTGGGSDFFGILNNKNLVKKKLVMLNPLGKYDNSFNVNLTAPYPSIYATLGQPDGKTILSGYVQQIGESTLMRINADGSKDLNFNVGSGPRRNNDAGICYVLKEQAGVIYVGGTFDSFNGVTTSSFVSLNMDGTTKSNYPNLPADSYVNEVAIQSDGKIILSGTFPFTTETKEILRLNNDGSIDATFNNIDLRGYPTFVEVDALDRIYLGGDIYSFNGALINDLIRLLPDGNLDTSFNIGSGFSTNAYLLSFEFLPDHKIALGGYFSSYQNTICNGFLIIDEMGNLVTTPEISFGLGSVANDMKYKNGALYLAGRFVKSDYSDIYGNAKIIISPVALPLPPNNVNVSLLSAENFKIDWKDNGDNEIGFVIERSANDELNYVAVDTVWTNTTTAIDASRLPFVNYFYRVRSINDAGTSSYSASANFTWNPLPVGQITLSLSQFDENKIQLVWTGVIKYHDGFILERSIGDKNKYETLDTLAINSSIYKDEFSGDNTYYYRIAAYNKAGRVLSNESSTVIMAVESSSSTAMIAYPIPAQDMIYARIENYNNGKWELLNLNGQVTPVQGVLADENISIDVRHVPTGLYILRYTEGNKVLTKKISKL